MYCSCLSSWKTSRFVYWTISSHSCSISSSSCFNLFSYSTIFCCIPFSLFSRFSVIFVSLSSFLFWISIVSFNCLMPCHSWLNFSFFDLDFPHVASAIMFGFFMSNINRSVISSKLQIVGYSIKLGYYTYYYNTIPWLVQIEFTLTSTKTFLGKQWENTVHFHKEDIISFIIMKKEDLLRIDVNILCCEPGPVRLNWWWVPVIYSAVIPVFIMSWYDISWLFYLPIWLWMFNAEFAIY